MKRTILTCKQRTPEWFAARCGIATASNFADIVTAAWIPTKNAARRTYRNALTFERLTREPSPHYATAAMERGQRLEPDAVAWYSMRADEDVEAAGFAQIACGDWTAGASPDALVGRDGGLEVKCPMPANAIECILDDAPPSEYLAQVHGNLWITDRAWWDLLVYSGTPAIPHRVWRIHRDAAIEARLAEAVEAFDVEVREATAKLVEMGGGTDNVMAGAAESFAAAFGGDM